MRIELLGASFSVQTDEDPAYLAEVVGLFKQKVAEIQQSVSTHDPLKIAILAGILTADECMKGERDSGKDGTEAGRITGMLIAELDEALGNPEDQGSDDEGKPESPPPSNIAF